MDAFAIMMASSQKATHASAKNKATRVPCPNCNATFPNVGAMTQHTKFKHKTKLDAKKNPKLVFPDQNEPRNAPEPAKKSPPNRKRKIKRKSPRNSPRKKAKTRRRYSNEKKYALILAYEALQRKDPLNCDVLFEMDHPAVPMDTLKKWLKPAQRAQIKKDGLSPNIRIREAKLGAKALTRYFEGAFPDEERELYDLFGNRRADSKRVTSKWLRAKMRKLVKTRLEKETAREVPEAEQEKHKKFVAKADEFQASRGWFRRWKRRFQVSLRRRSNKKTKSARERLPKVQKFHRTIKRFCQPPPEQDAKYGRFKPENRFHVDQVPLEFGGAETTYEKKGAKRVDIKRPKIDMERRVASLQLCFTAVGPQRVNPGIAFRAAPAKLPDGGVDPSRPQHSRLKTEAKKLPAGVDVYYQKKAWFDTATSLQFAKNFKHQVRPFTDEKLLGLDNLNSQCAPVFIEQMRKSNVQLIYTPEDCTDLCAVTDLVREILLALLGTFSGPSLVYGTVSSRSLFLSRSLSLSVSFLSHPFSRSHPWREHVASFVLPRC